MPVTRLTKDFFDRPVALVALELLGKILVRGNCRAMIMETEAYLKEGDEASHYVQRKPRAREAFAKGPGAVYIHPMRGYVGIDLVAADGSVLLRAIDLNKANGPGKLTRELGIGYPLHTLNVADPDCPLWLEEGKANGEVVVGPRFGIRKGTTATGLPLRFVLKRPIS